jgi:hypothetical protein
VVALCGRINQKQTIMAKLFSEGIVIMYDVKENVNAAAAEMRAAGANVKVEEDWAC